MDALPLERAQRRFEDVMAKIKYHNNEVRQWGLDSEERNTIAEHFSRHAFVKRREGGARDELHGAEIRGYGDVGIRIRSVGVWGGGGMGPTIQGWAGGRLPQCQICLETQSNRNKFAFFLT